MIQYFQEYWQPPLQKKHGNFEFEIGIIVWDALTDCILPAIAFCQKLHLSIQSLQKTLCREFENLSMDASEKIQDFFSKVTKIVNQIRSYGEELSHQKIVEKVLRSLPSEYDHVVAVIEESTDLSDYSVNELMGSLQAHEQRLARVTGKSVEQAFWSKVDAKGILQNSGRSNNSHGHGHGCGNASQGRGRGQFNGNQRNNGGSGFYFSCSI